MLETAGAGPLPLPDMLLLLPGPWRASPLPGCRLCGRHRSFGLPALPFPFRRLRSRTRCGGTTNRMAGSGGSPRPNSDTPAFLGGLALAWRLQQGSPLFMGLPRLPGAVRARKGVGTARSEPDRHVPVRRFRRDARTVDRCNHQPPPRRGLLRHEVRLHPQGRPRPGRGNRDCQGSAKFPTSDH